MSSPVAFAVASVLMLALVITQHETQARYLPTRSNGDRIDKLRELLKDLLETELEKEESDSPRWRPDSKYFVKREAKIEPAKLNLKSI